nr:hypothetical protein [Tanacetum cinerariifolium]
MTGNISYLSDYEPYEGGTPRQHNMYSIDLNNVVPYKDLTCLVAKASADESMLWHRRLGHLNFKTMNTLVRHNLVKGLPSKCFDNDHTCVAFMKGKQHKASSRTMLADAKLPVTFWAEAVNTACYVQNRVLVTKSQNKTPYELFNGRTPAIGFLKPFGCHVMILNTLDHLRKFEAKGDEGYFIGYSMSSKAFRDPEFLARVYKVEKAMYGLHQAPRAWYGTLSKYLLTNGFQRGTIDQTFFIKKHRGDFILVQVYVDDIIFGSSNLQLCKEFEALMHEKFQMSVMGELNLFLGLQVLQKKDGIFLSQDKYVGDILKKFGYSDVRSANTPMDKENPWEKDRTGKDVDLHLYISMIKALMYLTASRLDIMFAVCACARHQVTPKECHLHAVKRIFKYLKGHSKLGKINLMAMQKATIVATSTTEAEYVAAASGCGQVLWIQNQLLDYGHQVTPKECHLHTVKRIFRYLKGHPKMGLWYSKESPFDLVTYSDSDYGDATQDRKLTTGGSILEKYEYNIDFHQIVDFVEASLIRIKTTDEGTKILTTVDGKPITISESSIRRNLKLKDEAGISSLPDAELFENLTLMGYNILPNQKFSFQKGTPTEPHHTPSLEAPQSPQHDLSSSIHPPSLALPTAADEPASLLGDDSQGKACPTVYGLEAEQDRANIIKTSTFPHDSPPRVTSLAADEGSMQQHLNELTDLCTRLQRQQTEMASKLTAQDLEIANLKARIKMLEDKDGGVAKPSGEDPIIKGRNLETGKEEGVDKSTERGSNDTKELVNVPTSLDAANILTSRGVQVVSVPPAVEVSTVSVPTGSGMVPTSSLIFTTASVVTSYSRRKGKEKMVESDTPKKKKLQEQIDVQVAREMEEQLAREDQRRDEQIARDNEIARIHAEEELQMMIDGLDKNNEVIARHLHEYEQASAELTIGEKIELINELVKYQDHHSKILKYQAQQSKPLSKKKQREFYMSVLKSHSRWKTKHFKGMSLEEIREKFIPVWKQIEDIVPMGSKEEGERFKRKGLRLEQDSVKKVKTSEEVSEEDLKIMMQLVPVEKLYVKALQVKHLIIDWEIHTEGQRTYWKIIRLGRNTDVYQFFVDMLKHFDRGYLNQLWTLVKETLSIRHATSDKEKELWLWTLVKETLNIRKATSDNAEELWVELKKLYEPDVEDQLWTHTQALIYDPVEWRLYDTCCVHHVLSRDQEIFMMVEREYPLRKGLAIVMISNKLQVENYSQMANDLILKIHKIANSPRQRND